MVPSCVRLVLIYFCGCEYLDYLFFFFFFQAEDGIRDPLVTGVQTCALPIYIKPPQGAPSKVTGSLTLQSDGAPISYEWSAQSEKTNGAHIVFANGVARITLEMQGAHPFQQDLSFNSPLIAVLDNNLYYQYAVLARIYDWSKGGEQTFPVLIPQDLTPGTVRVVSTGSASADGKTYEGLKVSSSDLEIQLLLDNNHRLIRLEVPEARVSVIRE